MNILIITKDLKEGEDISEHCFSLINFLKDKGLSPEVICQNNEGDARLAEGLKAHEVSFILEGNEIFDWAMMMNNEILRKAREIHEDHEFDIIHAHEWSTLSAGITLKKYFEIPLITTIHSTENNRGFGGPQGSIISEIEYKGAQKSDKIIAPNKMVADSLKFDLNVEEKKITEIDPLKEGWRKKVLKSYREVNRTA